MAARSLKPLGAHDEGPVVTRTDHGDIIGDLTAPAARSTASSMVLNAQVIDAIAAGRDVRYSTGRCCLKRHAGPAMEFSKYRKSWFAEGRL